MLFWLGLIGALGSGKSSAIEHLRVLFPVVHDQSLSELLRNDLRSDGVEITRHTCRDRAHALRQRFGADILMCRALDSFADVEEGVVVIDGIRNMGELRTFKKVIDAFTIGFPADPDVRFDRVFRRLRSDDPIDEQELRAIMDEEMTPGPEWGFNVSACLMAADFSIDANLSLDEANRELNAVVKEILLRCSSAEKA